MINMQRPTAFSNPLMPYLALVVALYTFVSSAGVYASDEQMEQMEQIEQNSPSDACFASLRSSHTTLEACINALTRLPEQSIESARVFSALALLHARQRNLVAARNAMDTALSITADDVVVQGNLGSLLIAESNFRGAVLAFNDALALASEQATHAALYLNRSLALRAMGQYDEAAKDYELYQTLSEITPASPPLGPTQVPVAREPFVSKGFVSQDITPERNEPVKIDP